MIKSVFDDVGLLGDVLLFLLFLDGLGLLEQALLLLDLCLGSVFVEQAERLGGEVLVEDVLELGDGRWDFETEVEDLLLALETDVFGPFDHARKVTLRLDILADTEIAGTLFDKRVLDLLRPSPALGEWCGRSLLSFRGLVIERY